MNYVVYKMTPRGMCGCPVVILMRLSDSTGEDVVAAATRRQKRVGARDEFKNKRGLAVKVTAVYIYISKVPYIRHDTLQKYKKE